jgi:hypothetical protein
MSAKDILLPNQQFPSNFDVTTALLCTQLINQAYEMFNQWKEQDEPKESEFRWAKPKPIDDALTYSEPLWGTISYRMRVVGPGKMGRTRQKTERAPISFIAAGSRDVYVAFRGTQTKNEWTSINAILLPMNCAFDTFKNGKVHLGFLNYYETIRDSLLRYLKELSVAGKRVVFTGHSLGAALSTLATLDAAPRLRDCRKISHYNFGCPRVFNPTLARNYETLPVTTFRIANTQDAVPAMPLASFGPIDFQHVGTSIYFSAKQAPHSMVTYTYALEHPKKPEKPT